MLIAGEASATQSVSTGALLFDVRTGAAVALPGDAVLHERRAFATVTEFGNGMLVAGGFDPSPDEQSGPAHVSAEVLDGTTRRFGAEPILLADARSHHAAAVLPSGETLLVGGLDADGASLGTLEAVSPETRGSRLGGLATLETARIDPQVVVLDDGRIVVAGGTDAFGQPIDSLEWLSADASTLLSTTTLSIPPGTHRSFVAMPGGALLAAGSAPLDAPYAWWIGADGKNVEIGAGPNDAAVAGALLIPASDGAPWLADGTELRRFDPWNERFVRPELRPEGSPSLDLPAPIAPDPGLFLWLEHEAGRTVLLGFRHGTRGRFTNDVAPLLLGGAEHVVPDRAPGDVAGVVFDERGLVLTAARAVVTEARYGELEAAMVVTGAAPHVFLGAAELGGEDCRWPAEADSSAEQRTLSLLRGSAQAVLQGGGASRTCNVPPGRWGIALGAGFGASEIRSIAVRRAPGE